MKQVVAIAIVACVILVYLGFQGSTPRIAISTRPDSQKAGHLGIRLSLRGVNPAKASQLKAHIEVKAADGRVVHQDTANLEQFTFG